MQQPYGAPGQYGSPQEQQFGGQPGQGPQYGNQPYGNQPYGGPQQGFGGPGVAMPGQQPSYGGVPAGVGPGSAAGGLASWGQRVGAGLIDYVGLMLPYWACAIYYFTSIKPVTVNPTTGAVSGGVPVSAVFALLIGALYGLVVGLWNLYRQGTTGRTVGKGVVHIRVIREDNGQFTGFGGAFVRGLCHILDSLPCGIGYFAPLWDVKNQTWADKICHTVVVQG